MHKFLLFCVLIFTVCVFSSFAYCDDMDIDLDASLDDISSSSAVSDDPIIADPLEPFNRFMFSSYKFVYNYAGFFVVDAYSNVPSPLRASLTNFGNNLYEPVTAVNNLAQGRIVSFFKSTLRFAVNSTFGLLGFVDVASMVDDKYEPNDFGATLYQYGVGGGFYLFLLGPINFRDNVSLLGSYSMMSALQWDKYLDYNAITVFDKYRLNASFFVSIANAGVLYKSGSGALSASSDDYTFIKYASVSMRNKFLSDLQSRK